MQNKIYRVAEGVDHVNGRKVPEDRRVTLSEAEALYDRALGRIRPARGGKRVDASPDAVKDD